MVVDKRVIIADTEFFHLSWGADLGLLFCMAWKYLGEDKVHIESVWDTDQKDALDDKELCKRIRTILEGADMLVTYNGIKCDIPFIQTRLLHHGISPLPPIAHKDVYYTAKFKLKLSRNRLYDVENFLGLKNKKTPVKLYKWLEALVGIKSAQTEILTHCRQDVKVLEDAYLKLRPLMLSHPRLQGFGVCNKCGGTLLKNKTYFTAEKYNKITLKCKKCLGYETRRLTAAEQKELVNA